ncbi:MAG: ribose-phosphate pyrophosphokinase [Sphingomonadaceae bacterium]
MIDEFADDKVEAASALADVPRIEALLQEAARAGHALSYSELLLMLGLRFSRPKMRALCKTLDKIDERGAVRGEPALAVLVVRESDRLPGQGWWTGRSDYDGPWTGPAAAAHVAALQAALFAFWR